MALVSPRASTRSFETPPIDFIGSPEEWLRKTVQVVRGIMDGKINARGTVTLAVSVTTTVISDRRIGPDSFIGFMPTTANAAAEIGNGTMFVSSRGKETATITHASNAQADRSFTYIVLA